MGSMTVRLAFERFFFCARNVAVLFAFRGLAEDLRAAWACRKVWVWKPVGDRTTAGEGPMLWRFFLIRTKRVRIGIHKIVRPDDLSLGLHNHPWRLASFVLAGGYVELYLPDYVDPTTQYWRWCVNQRTRTAGDFQVNEPGYCHAIIGTVDHKPCWTLFVAGKRIAAWGFPAEGIVMDQRVDDDG